MPPSAISMTVLNTCVSTAPTTRTTRPFCNRTSMLPVGGSAGSCTGSRSRIGVNPSPLDAVAARSLLRQWHNWLSDTSDSLQKSDKGKGDA